MKRNLLTLLILLTLCLGALFACGDDGKGSASINSDLTKGTKWEGVTEFEGEKIKISLSIEQYNMKATIPSSDRYIRGSNEATSDEVQNLVFNRNKNVRDMLGIEVEYQEVKHQYAEVQEYIDELVMAATDETPDIFVDDAFGSIRSAMNGNLRNVLDQDASEGTNYFVKFGLTEENGWYVDYMNGLTFNPAVKYILAGDYFIDVLREAHVLFINIDRYEESTASVIEILYNDIKEGKWDYDYLSALTSGLWTPAPGNNGSAAVDDDLIGLVIDSISVYPFLYGSNEDSLYIKDNDGSYSVLYENQDYFTFASDIFNMLTGQAVYRTTETNNGTRSSTLFANGNVLLAEGMWLSDLENPEVRDMKGKKGVIVYPKPVGVKSYNTYIHDIAEIGSIAMSTNKFSACTAYLQLVNEESEAMIQQYKEFALKYKFNKDAATVEMIDVIYDSIGSPFEGIMGTLAFDLVAVPGDGTNTPKNTLLGCVNTKNNTFVNTYQTSYNVYVAGIAELVSRFENPDR